MGDQHKMFSDIVHLQTLSSCIGNCDSAEAWLSDSNNGGAADLTGSDQGTFGPAAINAYWPDPPAMDDIRGAAEGVAGDTEAIGGNVAHTDSNNAETGIENNAEAP